MGVMASGSPAELLRELIAQGKLSEEVLCAAAKLSPEELELYFAGELAPLSSEKRFLTDLAVLLGQGLDLIDDDARIQAVVDCLIETYQMTEKMIAGLLSVDADTIRRIRTRQETDWQTKYHVAVKLYYVFYALRYPDYKKAGEA